ncbi:hypothetical protein Z517_01605 [Fonsecaea pedrosoi CBS 271.37]|uniref:Unplaced genomic scaffold supercont1.1, whole genome shotgun sequence n=1 Tax=Fonsecaea pedrosoi CBS 271.37 TaxID=1442368 RepID=A0A0D2H5R4_9EURO|nr:uncharacterized protein Z517_01605 [Fonsecaea pedrosoi CBS 271.37]KIW86210.1 hypothetical protein Z517_01605 [Fonsecaea pedrosoi CBS 271.37]
MASAEEVKYERLEAGGDELDNVPLNEKQDAAFASPLPWRRRTSLTTLEIAIRVVLGFFLVLSLLNIGFLLGDRIIGRRCDRGMPASTSSDDTIWTWMVETAVVLNVSREEMYSSGNAAALETVVELDQDNGGGFMGTLEVFHQLHCLNVLRKWTYWDHYVDTDPFFQTRADHRREHADHCIDVLRQALMCKSDLGLILFHWVKDIQIPSPDFNTLHQCRDPEAVLSWAHANEALVTHTIVKSAGVTEAEHPF